MNKRILGWISFLIAVMIFIAQAVMPKNGTAFGVIEGCLLLFAAIMLLDPVKNEKAMKQVKTELKDERNLLIQGKAATFTLAVILFLSGVLATYLLSINLIIPGYLVLGIDMAGIFIFGLSVYIIGKRM